MNGQKISAAVIAAKSIKDYFKFASAVMSAIVDPAKLVDKVASAISDPEFLMADDQLDWLVKKVSAVIISSITEVARDPLTKITVGYSFADLAGLTVGDVVDEKLLEKEG